MTPGTAPEGAESQQPDARPSLGEILHRARQAGGEGRPRPWPPESWEDRDPRLKALDEAMAEAVARAVRDRSDEEEPKP